MLKLFSQVCLFNFLIAALFGLLLRYSTLDTININYRHLTHAHSHVAMLGWIYQMLYTFIVFNFIEHKREKFIPLFWLTQVSVVGMLLSFPFQGYGVISIIFSTMHILCSYVFVFWVWKELNNQNEPSTLMLKSALVFMLISTVGVWSLGPIIAFFGKTSPYYDIAIQLFLHFQFNGWFLFGVLALLVRELKIRNLNGFKPFFYLLFLATITTSVLPVHWFKPNIALPYINGIGVFLQLLAFIFLFRLIYYHMKVLTPTWSGLRLLTYAFVLFSLLFKVIMQGTSLIPELAEVLYQFRNFIIGYIHLAMLGIITGLLFSSLLHNFVTKKTRILDLGFILFYLGFVATEFLIFYQAISFYLRDRGIEMYNVLLFWASIPLVVGILWILLGISLPIYSKEL